MRIFATLHRDSSSLSRFTYGVYLSGDPHLKEVNMLVSGRYYFCYGEEVIVCTEYP
jgi:hypothetical protein